MIKTTANLGAVSKDEVLDILENGYDGLVITGAEEIEDGEDPQFYDADMWISHIKSHGFNSSGLYKDVEVRTIFTDGVAQFSYLAFIL